MDQDHPSSEPLTHSQKALYSFLAAARFLTILPVSWRSEKDIHHLPFSLYFFPVVGLLAGFFIAGLSFIVGCFFSQSVVAVIAVVLLIAVSGGLHMDGLADSFDGLFSSRDRQKTLTIMRDSRIGVMGVLAVISIFCLKWSVLSSLEQSHLIGTLVLVVFSGRVSMLMSMAVLDYVRTEGLGTPFLDEKGSNVKMAAIIGCGLYLFCLFIFPLLLVAFSFLATLLTVVLFSWYCQRKIGGYTGDTLGGTCELTETAVCMAMVFANTLL